eukprot:10561749-Heterocapsa_arctica.AAC.1
MCVHSPEPSRATNAQHNNHFTCMRSPQEQMRISGDIITREQLLGLSLPSFSSSLLSDSPGSQNQ